MIEHVWSVLCLRSVIDKESNNITLYEVVEQIRGGGALKDGVALIQLELVTLWSRSDSTQPTQGRARVQLIAPDGKEHPEVQVYNVDLTSSPRVRQRLRMGGIPIRGTGNYIYQVEVEKDSDWDVVARIPLDVKWEEIEQPVPGQIEQ